MLAIGPRGGYNFNQQWGKFLEQHGNGTYSTIVSLCRQMLVLLPVAYLLSKTGEVNAVWLSFIIAEVISLAVTLTFFRRIYRQKIKPLFEAENAQ